MARHVARRYRHGSEPLEDLEQVASLGLLKAIDRFDPERGMAFSSLAVPTIAGEIQRHFRDRTWSVRVPRSMHDAAVRVRRAEEQLQGKLDRATTVNDIAQHLGMDVEEVLDARAASFAHYAESLDRPRTTETAEGESEIVHHSVEEPGFRAAEDTATLERLLECLDDRQRTILRLRFKEDLLQWEIATRVGCSQMHVSRLLRQAIATLQLAAEPASSDGSPSAHPQPARSPHG